MLNTHKHKELPIGWSKVNLGDCVHILDSKRVPVNATERESRIVNKPKSDLYPYYGATGQVGWIDDFLFDEELVLLGEDGAPFLDSYKDKAYIIKGKSWVNNHAHVLRAIAGLMLNTFLCHCLNVSDFSDYVTGTTRLKLNQSRMRKMPILIPPLSEQHRIVAKIEELFPNLDAGVEALKKVQAQLKRYRQSVLKYAFEGKLTQEWREEHKGELEPASLLLERIKEERRKKQGKKHKELPPVDTSDLPELPEGWGWTNVDSLSASMTNGIYKPKHFYTDDGVACLRMYNIEDGRIVWRDIKRMALSLDDIDSYKLEPGDILVNRVNSLELVGKSAIIPDGLEICIFESKNIRLRLNSNANSRFAQYWLQLYGHRYFSSNFQQTTGMASINQKQLGLMEVPYCCIREQNKIVDEIDRRLSISDGIDKAVSMSIKQSDRLRQSILKKAFEGKLVPQDQTDEPAEKLLERIKEEKVKLEAEAKKNKLRAKKRK